MHFNFQVHVRGRICKRAGNNPERSIEAGMEKIIVKMEKVRMEKILAKMEKIIVLIRSDVLRTVSCTDALASTHVSLYLWHTRPTHQHQGHFD